MEDVVLNAPTNTSAVTATSTSLGEYKEVACSSNTIFSQNSCNQCFEGGSVKVGDKKTDLFDNWTNTTQSLLVAVKDEQKIPNMVSFGATWTPSNTNEALMWKSHENVIWTPGENNKEEFILSPGQKVGFIKSDLGAGYKLESTTKNHGDVVGLLRFPVVYHVTDMATGNRGAAETHYECVSYTLDKPATPVTPEKPKPKPETPTKVETGPAETLLLIVAAFFIAFGLMISLRKRNN